MIKEFIDDIQQGKADSICRACWNRSEDKRKKKVREYVQRPELFPPLACDDCVLSHNLDEENGLAWRIFIDCHNQNYVISESILGISNEAIWKQIDEEAHGHIEPRMVTFRKVKAAEREYVRIKAEQLEKYYKDLERKNKVKRESNRER